jgi:hypothetical protein
VRIESGVRVVGLVETAWGVTVVRLDDERALACELVIDASGRNSELPRWLGSFGLPAPEQERVRMELSYTSCLVRRRRDQLDGKLSYVWLPAAPGLRAGAALAVEHERFIVTLMGNLGERAPRDFRGMALTGYLGDPGARTHEGFLEYARSIVEQSVAGPVQAIHLEGARLGIQQPHVRHALTPTDGQLEHAILALGGRRQHHAQPVGAHAQEGRIEGQLGKGGASPPGQVGHQDVRPQVQLGLVQQDPATGSATPASERSPELRPKHRSPLRVNDTRSRLRVQHAVDHLGDQMLGRVHDVLVARALGDLTANVVSPPQGA